jgi:hypothetical protein
MKGFATLFMKNQQFHAHSNQRFFQFTQLILIVFFLFSQKEIGATTLFSKERGPSVSEAFERIFLSKYAFLSDTGKTKVKKTVKSVEKTETKAVAKSAYFDFTHLLEDDKISITMATGYTEEVTDNFGVAFHVDLAEKIKHWLLSRGFYPTQTEGNIREFETTEFITDPENQKVHKTRISVTLIMPGKGSAKAFMKAMNTSEIIYYAGHARGGLGPDFDTRNSSDEQLVWGLHDKEKTNKYDNPTGGYYKKITHNEGNDLEKAYAKKEAKTTPSTYRIWMLNACKTSHFLDEFENGLTPNKDQLDVILTNNLVYMGSYFESMHLFMDAILQPTPVDKMISDMNTLHVYISEEADWEPKKPYFYKRIK